MTDETPPFELAAAREAILAAALELAPFEGFTVPMLRRAAAEAGVARSRQLLAFPKGIADLLAYWSERADEEARARIAALDLPALRVRDRIASAVRIRIEVLAPHKDAARMAVRLLALPFHAPLALRLLARSLDMIWRSTGDTSTDFNYYSKRAILSGVFTSTLLCWLEDRSEGAADSWAFLGRRIENVMGIEKAKAGLRKAAAGLPSPLGLLARLRYPGTTRNG